MSERAKKKAFLVGAGFSYDLGMPLASELTDVFLSLFDEEGVAGAAAELATHKPYSEDRLTNPSAIAEGLALVLQFKAENGHNYEGLLRQLESMGDRPGRRQTDRDSYSYLFETFYNLIHTILVGYQCESYRLMFDESRRFFSDFRDVLSNDETWIFSLNHDLYVELLAMDLKIPITYGDSREISFPLNNLPVHPTVRLSCSRREDLVIDNPAWFSDSFGVNLVRLHGGLTEFEYQDGTLICNPVLRDKSPKDAMADLATVEAMGHYGWLGRIPSGRDRTITGPNGALEILRRAILTGGRKYSKTMDDKPGEEKLRLFSEVLATIDELTIIGYGFGDAHINNRISNAMVLNRKLSLNNVNPSHRRWIDLFDQFSYGIRLRSARAGAAEWMSYARTGKWDDDQMRSLKMRAPLREEVKASVRRQLLMKS